MRPELSAALIAAGNSTVLSILFKVTVTTTLGLTAAALARRSRAAVRHVLLAATFGLLLIVPAVSLIAPPFRIAMTVAAGKDGVLSATTEQTAGVGAAVQSKPSGSASSSRPGLVSIPNLLLAAWLVGTVLFVLPVAVGLRQMRALRRAATAWPEGQEIVDRLASSAHVCRRVNVFTHGALAGPITSGAVHPFILLPDEARDWESDDLERAVVHELEHVRRCDWVSQCAARTICAFYWFHPLVWMARRRLGLEAERACDDAVLQRSEATAYADQLVAIAKRLSKRAKLPLPAMANRADLAKRVGAVLDSRQRRGPLGVFGTAAACAVAVLLAVTLSPLRLVAAEQSATASGPEETVRTFQMSTDLVMVDVNVTESDGQAVNGLTAADFAVNEDGRPRTIRIFESQGTPGQYLLGYYTPNLNRDGNFRQIQVIMQRLSGLRLDYRMGYYGPGPGSQQAGGSSAATGTGPMVLHKVDPEYSEEARKAKYQGTVVVDAEVDATGRVRSANVRRSLGLGLDEKVIEAVRQWKFRPAMQDGQAVASTAEVVAHFHLL